MGKGPVTLQRIGPTSEERMDKMPYAGRTLGTRYGHVGCALGSAYVQRRTNVPNVRPTCPTYDQRATNVTNA